MGMAQTAVPAERLQVAARLRLAVTRLNRRLRAEGDIGLSPGAMSALSNIDRHGLLSLGELAAMEGVKPPSITATLSGLEAAGLVARELDGRDRRITRVKVTAAGKQRLERSKRRKTAFLAARLERLQDRELEELDQALELIERLLENRA
jgi:DNA-binding MarR family transcriptional regulator